MKISTLLKRFVNRYKELNARQYTFWLALYSFIWIALSLSEYSDQKQIDSKAFMYESFIDQFGWVFCFGLLSPLLSVVCQQWSLERTKLPITIIKLTLFYIPFKMLYTTLVLLSNWFLYWAFINEAYKSDPLMHHYVYQIVDSSPIYIAAIFLIYTLIYFETAQREQIHSAKLESELQKSKMEVLRNQLHPHFLFNTLNLISSTMYQDVDKADSIVTRLGDLLRYSLATEQKPVVSLKEELQVMQSYLEIASLRFGDRLEISIDIDPQSLDVLVPAMLLQPLLENAVKYGIEPSDENGHISLKTLLKGEELKIWITNPWHQRRAQQESFGIGLHNTRNRLKLLYDNLASVTLKSNDKQVTLQITLPAERSIKAKGEYIE